MPDSSWWNDLFGGSYNGVGSQSAGTSGVLTQEYRSGYLPLAWTSGNSSTSGETLISGNFFQPYELPSQQGMQQQRAVVTPAMQAEYERIYSDMFAYGQASMKFEPTPKAPKFKRNLPDWF